MNGAPHPNLVAIPGKLGKHLRSILSPYWGQGTAVIGLIFLASGLEGISFSLLVPLTKSFTVDPGSAAHQNTPEFFQVYEGWLAGYPSADRLALLGLALLALFGLKNGVQYLREVLSTRLWLGISAETRRKALAGLLRRPYRYFLDRKQGSLVQHLYHEPQLLAYVVQGAIEQFANFLTVVVLFGLLVMVSWKVTALVVTLGALHGLAIWRLSNRAHAGGEERQLVESESVALLTEAIGGIRQVKVFSSEPLIQQVYAGWVQRFRDLYLRHWLSVLLPQHVAEVFGVGVLAVLLCLPALGIFGEVGTVLPVVAVFAAVAFRVGPYVSRISQGWLTLRFFLPALRVVGDLMEEPAQPAPRPLGARPFRSFSDSIRLEDVSFSYGAMQPALSHLSARFNRGETTAVIGPSGAGKSTLVDLLVRLYEPSAGRITVDGVDLREFDMASWLGAIGFVSQDTFIFHGTIRDNLCFSYPGASLQQVKEAARLANADEFIERLPEGYETVVGDRGLKLSGGERQRVAIARALIRQPQILIFDEATSALDSRSETLIQEAIANIAKNRTVILIAHRFSTLLRADRIIVLENGMFVEEGTHATLLKGGGLYASLYSKEEA